MSTAQLVPETWELDGDDARAVLKEARFTRLLADSFRRMRAADGFSHSRSLALAMILTVVPGVIAVVGLATVLGSGDFREGVADLINAISPGQSGDVLTAAIQQGSQTPTDHGVVPLIFGVIAMSVSGTTFFGQIERGANRIYGIEQDRPSLEKYRQALALFGAAFVLFAAGFFVVGLLHDIDAPGPDALWIVVRGLALFAAAAVVFAVVFRVSPRRHQPEESWLVVGSSIATIAWTLATVGLALFWRLGSTFGDTYGPLAGLMALTLWSYLISIGLFIGVAFAAQLEAVRSGRAEPQDSEKVEESEPDAADSEDAEPMADAPERGDADVVRARSVQVR